MILSFEVEQCYVCYESASMDSPFITAGCACRGTMNIHAECFKRIGKAACSICKVPYGREALNLLVRKVLEYDENGKLSAEIGILYDSELEADVYHGESRYFFEDGRLWIWCNYDKDRLCGFFRIYGKDGVLSKESWYK